MVKLPAFRAERQKGQALLLILLVMSLALTLVLSSVSRSVTDVEISKYEDDAIRAFDAAQAGIEKIMVGGTTSGTKVDLGNQASYIPVVASGSASSNYVKYPLMLSSGESAVFFFVNHNLNANGDLEISCGGGGCSTPTQIRLCWGMPGTPSDSDVTPALYVQYYYNFDEVNPDKWQNMSNLADIRTETFTADTNATRRTTLNNFSAPDTSGGVPCNIEPSAFSTHYDSFPVGKRLLFMKVTMLYNDTPQPLGIRSASPLPSQGNEVASTGQSGDVYRKLMLYQGYPEIPFELENAIYSKQSLTK